MSLWSCTLPSNICCFLSSFKHFVYIGVSFRKIISLYLRCVSTTVFSSYIQLLCFQQQLQQYLLTDSFFQNSYLDYKKLVFCAPAYGFFYTSKYPSTSDPTACCTAGFLHQCIYTLQHIPEDDSFYPACIQRQSLKLLLHCNTCHMVRLRSVHIYTYTNTLCKCIWIYTVHIEQKRRRPALIKS